MEFSWNLVGNPITTDMEDESCTGLALVQETYGINWAGRQCYLLTKPSVWHVAQVRNLRGLYGWSRAVEYHSRT